MALLDKLTVGGSNLSAYDGTTPKSYDKQTNYPADLAKSTLDLDGKTPLSYNRQSKLYNRSSSISIRFRG
jgi:hypothetical protein